MLPSASPSRTLVRNALRVLGVFAVLVVLAALYIAVVGISIDASAQRGRIAHALTAKLGREVRFDGPLQLEVSARPRLRVGGLHVANAAGYTGGEFASLGEARLVLDLWALLHLHLEVEELNGSGVHIRLQMNKRGAGNWTFHPSAADDNVVQRSVPAQTKGQGLASLLSVLDIQRVTLDNLDVEFIGPSARSHYFQLQSLTARFPAGQPLVLSLEGKVEKAFPYRLELTGGALADLARRDTRWPFEMTLGFMNSQLALNGTLSGSGGVINFGLGSGNLREFERLFQTKLPEVGAAGLSGAITYAPGKLSADRLNGVMGKTSLYGSLQLDFDGERPSVRGELTLPVLDLWPFISGRPAREEQPRSLAELYRDLAGATFSLKQLREMDAGVSVRVGKWLSLPGDVHDATLQVQLAQGRLSMPLHVTAGGIALSGAASIDASRHVPRFRLGVGASKSGAGNLAGLLVGMPDVQGRFGRLDLDIRARGDNGAELMQSLDVLLQLERGELSYGQERPVHFTLDNLKLALPAGSDLSAEARGALLDHPFSAQLHGGTLTAIMQQAHVPIDFALRAGSATAEVHALIRPPALDSGSEVNFQLSAPHSRDIATWLGLRPGADASLSIAGSLHTRSDGWRLAGFSAQLGRTAFSADVQRTSRSGAPLTRVQLTGEMLDLAELRTLLPEPKTTPSPAATRAAADLINVPILPQGISLADADIVVRIKRVASALPLEVRDLRFDGRIRDGMMLASPFAVNAAETEFNGAILLDLRGQQPHAMLWLAAGALDIGSILGKLGLAQNVKAGIGQLRIFLDMHSSRLGEILAQSELAMEFEGGHLDLRDANTGSVMHVALTSGVARSSPGAPVYLDLDGALGDVPVLIGVQTATAADLINPAMAIPFKFNASVSGAAIQLAGDIDRPFNKQDLELQLDASGVRLDNLDVLTRTSLPPWGPWAASGRFHMSPAGYEVTSLLLQIGSSQLTGNGKVDTQAVPPRVDVALTAPVIQLDDFRWGDWSPEKNRRAAAKTDSPAQIAETTRRVEKILSAEVLRRQNAYLAVNVDQVLSGKDSLGEGHLEAQLQDGRAEIGPVVVNTPGGSALLRLVYQPRERGVEVGLRTEVKRLDYGILARRIDPKTEMRGTFSLDVDLSARAQSLSELLPNGNGHIDFAVWPENLKSGRLDIWAVNVLMALLPKVDSSDASRVNCAIGRFVLDKGKLSDKMILIDTTRMRVTGKGRADFSTKEIELYLRPRAKTPQFLSLATPLEVTGSFSKFHVGVRARDVVETVAQFATSVVWVPLKSLFGKVVPADGSDVCLATGL